MPAKLIYQKKIYDIHHGMTIRTALKKLKINPETILPTKNGELITDDEIIEDGDQIRLVRIISGG